MHIQDNLVENDFKCTLEYLLGLLNLFCTDDHIRNEIIAADKRTQICRRCNRNSQTPGKRIPEKKKCNDMPLNLTVYTEFKEEIYPLLTNGNPLAFIHCSKDSVISIQRFL